MDKENTDDIFQARKWKNIILALFTIVTAVSLAKYYFVYVREPWEQVGQYIAENEKPGELIIFTQTWASTFNYKGSLNMIPFYWYTYKNVSNYYSNIWLIYANYNQGMERQQKQELKDWLDQNYDLASSKEFRDDSNELSGNIMIYYYKKRQT